MWANFYTCTATRGIVLDFIPSTDWESFAESFRRFILHRRCPTHVISDCGRNIISFIHSHLLTISALPGIPVYHCFHGMWGSLSV